MKRIVFYLGLALLFTHELDAMPNHEWQVLPLLSDLTDSVAQQAFVIAHVPIFAVVIACIASLNLKTRAMARDTASGFLGSRRRAVVTRPFLITGRACSSQSGTGRFARAYFANSACVFFVGCRRSHHKYSSRFLQNAPLVT